ncbi:hypothetical protein D3C71_1623500 [compost metagenome]
MTLVEGSLDRGFEISQVDASPLGSPQRGLQQILAVHDGLALSMVLDRPFQAFVGSQGPRFGRTLHRFVGRNLRRTERDAEFCGLPFPVALQFLAREFRSLVLARPERDGLLQFGASSQSGLTDRSQFRVDVLGALRIGFDLRPGDVSQLEAFAFVPNGVSGSLELGGEFR